MSAGRSNPSRGPLNGIRQPMVLLGAAMGTWLSCVASTASAQDGEAGDLEEVVVTGSRIARSGFTTPTPVTLVGAEQMEKLGISNIGDALNQLPSFRATVSPNTSNVFFGAIGARTADLRGLGPQRTLVLVDGRRFVGTTSQGTVDLNLIPTSLVQRSEVVTGGASAAYGSDAVAGVVNLILDKEFTGFRAQAEYGQAEVGDNGKLQVSLAGGTDLLDGRMHVIAGGEFEDSDGAGNTYYSRDWGRKEWNVIPNPLFCAPGARIPNTPCAAVPANQAVSLNGLPANVLVSDSHTATMTTGGLIKTPGPLFNTAFAPDASTYAFQQGQLAGPIFMTGGEGHGKTGFFQGGRLAVPVERYTTYSYADFDITDSLKAFAEVTFARVRGYNTSAQTRDFAIPGASNGIRIAQDNAYLPDSVRQTMINANIPVVFMGRQGNDMGFTEGKATSTVERYVAGLNGDLWGSWSWDAYYQYGSDRFEQKAYNDRITRNFSLAVDAVVGPTGNIVCRSTLTDPANGCVPLNLFGENNWSQAAHDYAFGTSEQQTRYTQQVGAVNVQGELFDLPAGPVSLAAGLEYREDEAVGTADPISSVQGFYVGNAAAVNGVIRVKEGYLEAVVPLLRDLPFAKTLELNGAVRETDYNLSGSVNTWKAGLVYAPNDTLRFRATRSRDIRAPNLEELYVTSATFVTVRDPFRGNQQSFPFVRLTSASGLEPEEADTFTAGVIFTPHWGWSEGLRLSADYYDIEINGAISRPTAQTVLDRCYAGATEYCALITRTDPNDPSVIVPPTDPTGVLTRIDTPNLNIQSFKMSGADFEADYTLTLSAESDLRFRLLASYVRELITTDTAGSIDRAGMTGFPIGLSTAGNKLPALPTWTFNATVTWDTGPLSLTADMRYIDAGTFDVTLIGPDNPAYDVNLPNSISDNTVSSRFYLDLAAQYNLVDTDSARVQLFAGIDNFFDRDPPIAPGNSPTNLFLFDGIGRAYKAGVRVRY